MNCHSQIQNQIQDPQPVSSSKATPRGKGKVQTTPMRIRDELEPRHKALSSSKKSSVSHLDQQLLVQLKTDFKLKPANEH